MWHGSYNFAIPIGFQVFKCVPTAMILPEFLALIFVFLITSNISSARQHKYHNILTSPS